MNTKMSKLFEQACFETEYDDNQNMYLVVERFGELIVEECLFTLDHNMTEQEEFSYQLESSYDQGYVAAKNEASFLIRDQFDMVDLCGGFE